MIKKYIVIKRNETNDQGKFLPRTTGWTVELWFTTGRVEERKEFRTYTTTAQAKKQIQTWGHKGRIEWSRVTTTQVYL